MSGPLLTAVNGKRANPVPPASGEVVGNLLEFPHGFKECRGPETSTDDEPSDPVSDVNQAINNFDRWRLFQENCRVQLSIFSIHAAHPALTLTRQAKGEPERVTASLTCVRKTAQNGERFQWVPNRDPAFRPTAVIFPTQPANDRGWHPLDAA